MKTIYIVMIQNEEYQQPEICFATGSDDVGLYVSAEEANKFIDYMVAEGFPKEDYFVAKVERIKS